MRSLDRLAEDVADFLDAGDDRGALMELSPAEVLVVTTDETFMARVEAVRESRRVRGSAE